VWPVTGSGCGIRHISDCMHDSNEHTTAIFICFWVKLPNGATSVTDCRHRKWVTHVGDRIPSSTNSAIGKHDHTKIGVAVGIPLLSCLQAALCAVKV